MKPFYSECGSTVHHGDCLAVLAEMPANSVDTVITDPPYGLGFMGKDWDSPGGTGDFPMRRTNARNTVNTCASRQGGRQRGCEDWAKRQARDMQAFQAWTTEWALAVLRVAKPGAFMLAFGGTRTFHRLTCGIEEAGWEIRDCINWMYGQGFPKSLDISKAMDKAAGIERESVGTRSTYRPVANATRDPKGFQDRSDGQITLPATPESEAWNGWGTALKPAWEPIIVAMKPLDGTFVENAQRHGVAGLNIDGGRVSGDGLHAVTQGLGKGVPGSQIYGGGDGFRKERRQYEPPSGRWPANVVLDEAAAGMLDEATGDLPGRGNTSPTTRAGGQYNAFGKYNGVTNDAPHWHDKDGGGASRFFYTAKASKSDRGAGNDHPTVKPTDLLKYLCTLTATPTGGLILDPFAGSGTTLVAARECGRPCIGIELDEAHCRIIVSRLAQGVLFGLEVPA